MGGDFVGRHPDSPPDGAATQRAAGSANTVAAGVPSLVLLDSMLAMAPSHQTALRCRASTLARLGRTPDALAAAGRAVSAAETAIRAAETKSKDPGYGRTSEYASASAATSVFPLPAASTDGKNHAGTGHRSDALTSMEADFGASAKVRAAKNREGAREGGGEERCGISQWYSYPKSIGFMRRSKVDTAVGGLLLTGGGRASTMDVAKSLVLRGCLRQKMGRRKQAEDDYRQALRICHNRLREIEHGLQEHRTELGSNGKNDETVSVGGDKHTLSAQSRERATGEGYGGRTGGQSEIGEKARDANGEKGGDVPNDAESYMNGGVTKPGCTKDPRAFRGSSEVCTGAVDIGDSSGHQGGRYETLRLESLIRHNLVTVHLATVLGADSRVSFHKVRLAVVQGRLLTGSFHFDLLRA